MKYYLGAKAILARLHYRSPRMIHTLIVRDGLPAYIRVGKTKTGHRGLHRCWAISEAAITAWELTLGQQSVIRLRAREAQKAEQRATALAAQQAHAMRKNKLIS